VRSEPAPSFWQRLKQRHLIPVITGWFGFSWAMIEFSSFLVSRYAAPESLIDLVFVGMWTLLPAIALLTWWIGEAGAMRWTQGRALGIAVLAGAGLALAWRVPGTQPADQESTAAPLADAAVPVAVDKAPAPRVMLFPFKVEDGAADDHWLGDAMSMLTEYDLLFDQRLDVADAATTRADGVLGSIRAQGGKDFASATKAMLRHAAVASAYRVMVTGSIRQQDRGLSVRASLQGLSPDRDLGEFTFEAKDIWSAVDQLAALVREQLAPPTSDLPARDPPLASVTTESLPALRGYVEAARAAMQEKDYQRAATRLDEVIAADANFAAADVLRFNMRNQLGENLLARQIAEAMAPRIAMLPDRVRFGLQAYLTFMTGDMTKVRAVYELWARQSPNEREPRLMMAHLDLRAAPDDESAWQNLHELALDSGDARELLSLGSTMLVREQPARATELAMLARQRDPLEVGVPLLTAEIARIEGRHDEALRAVDEAALMRPELITPLLRRATLLFDTGRWDEASSVVDAARGRTGQNPAARADVLRGQIGFLQSRGRQQAAFDVLTELIDVERSRATPAMLARRMTGHVGLHASIKGTDAAREWIAQWNTFDDPRARKATMANLDLVIGLQMLDRALYMRAMPELERAWQEAGQPMSAEAITYQRLGQAWQSGSAESVSALSTAVREYQSSRAAAGESVQQLDSWRAMVVEIALLHGHAAIARPWLETLQRSAPREPMVLWFSVRAALLNGDRKDAMAHARLLRAAWKDADPAFPHLAEFRRVATELGLDAAPE